MYKVKIATRIFMILLTGTVLFFTVNCKKKYGLPVVTTADVNTVTSCYARCGGNATSDGGAIIERKGVCYGTSDAPTIDGTKTQDDIDVGEFTSKMTGLAPLTTYYARAYATNSVGTTYGSTVTFTTPDYPIKDYDGNGYDTVHIGTQVWMKQNLKTKHYRDGSAISGFSSDTSSWDVSPYGAYCNYNDNESYSTVYGRLYNWYAVHDNHNLAPAGWHVPTQNDLVVLYHYLVPDVSDTIRKDSATAGGKLKEKNFSHWISPNTAATDIFGFAALPGGFRTSNGIYADIQYFGLYRISDQYDVYSAPLFVMFYDLGSIHWFMLPKTYGASVRCIKD